jgi:UrcA family protein
MNTMTISTSLRGFIASAILGVLAAGVASVSTAAEGTEALQTIVKYGDLNVSTPQGAAALYNRIRVAADGVCWPLDHGDIASKAHVAACVRKAIAGAVTSVDQPALTAVYNAKYGQPLPVMIAAQSSR